MSYSKSSKDYDNVRSNNDYVIELIAKYIPFTYEYTHVDLGCGTCKETQQLSVKVKTFVGIDLSNEMLLEAKKKIPYGIFIEYDLQKGIPLENTYADSVSVMSFYHHIENKKKFFSEIFRILNPHGFFVMMTNSIDQIRARGYYSFFPSAMELNCSRFMMIDQLENLLKNVGFTVIASKPIERPNKFYDKELMKRINSSAFDSVLNLIPDNEYQKGIERIQNFFETNTKLESCRDRYLIVCGK